MADRVLPTTDFYVIQYLRYVTHDQVQAFLDKGWIVTSTLAESNHGFYAVLMLYEGNDEPNE